MVVGPGEPVALHIFEDRYKKMMKDIRVTQAPDDVMPFGISLFREKNDEIAPLGCTVQVLQVVQRYPDGRLDLVGEGRRRYRVCRMDKDAPYARAEVEFVDDLEPGADPLLRQAALSAVRGLLREAANRPLKVPEGFTGGISFWLAHDAGLDPEQKYALLEMRRENDRLAYLRDHARRARKFLRAARELKSRIEQNGHFRKFPELKLP